MKKIIYALLLPVLLAGCAGKPGSDLARKVREYELVRIPAPDLSYISDNGKEVLNLYRFIADEADSIYWKQCFGDKALMEGLADPVEREYALINYGPWDRLTGKAFVSGYGDRPAGSAFYPEDLKAEEFEALADSAKYSPYTLIRRDDAGGLTVIPYHDEYRRHIDKMCNYLQAAADITIKPSVRRYLLKKAEALRTDDYRESDIAWIDMTDSKMDLVVGPNESPDDQLYGLKNSYEAYVLLKDTAKTAEINAFTSKLAELQQLIPCKEEYRTFVPGKESDIFACNEIYCAGKANAAVKLIALNLPADSRIHREKGTRTIVLKNVLEEKFNRIVYPTGRVLMEQDQLPCLDADAFFWQIVFREVAHGLGVKQTMDGREVHSALGRQAFTIEDLKANLLGLYLTCRLIERHEIPALVTPEDAMTTCFVNILRSMRFGAGGALGRVSLISYNYLKEAGAFIRNESGKYVIDYGRFAAAVEELTGRVIEIQALGDSERAERLVEKYATVPEIFQIDLMNLGLEKIPIDIRFQFER